MRKEKVIDLIENSMDSLWCYSENATKKQIRKAIFDYRDNMIKKVNDAKRSVSAP